MSDIRIKKKLEDLVARSGTTKVSAEQLFFVLKNPANKYSNEKITQIVRQYVKPFLLDGDRLMQQFELNLKKQMSTYDAAVLMLNSATVTKPQQTSQKPQIPTKPVSLHLDSRSSLKTDTIESPALCSTRLELNTPEIVVSEVN
jgi:hypothetical protein